MNLKLQLKILSFLQFCLWGSWLTTLGSCTVCDSLIVAFVSQIIERVWKIKMKIRSTILALGIAATLTGCQNMDSNALLSSGAEAFQAYSLSDAQVKSLSDQACKEMDSKATLSPASSEYSKRLSKIAAALGDNINGQPVNYKVYETKDVNAFAMANGCIRLYSGLMDIMNDNEVQGCQRLRHGQRLHPRLQRADGSDER